MELLKERILKDGRVLGDDILKVDSFLNHQIDIELLHEIGREFYRRFGEKGINKIMTIESSGIAIACMTARFFHAPVVFAKKGNARNIGQNLFQAEVYSFTKGKEIEQENDKNEYIKYSQIISKINESDFVLQQFSSQEDSTGYLELFFVEGENSYTERFDFKNILQQSNNAFYYEKGKDESERTVK